MYYCVKSATLLSLFLKRGDLERDALIKTKKKKQKSQERRPQKAGDLLASSEIEDLKSRSRILHTSLRRNARICDACVLTMKSEAGQLKHKN